MSEFTVTRTLKAPREMVWMPPRDHPPCAS
jgi:hypothetical protein